jgi:hypothetical protein
MGCDYYTWIQTILEWKDTSGRMKQYIEKPEFEQYERHYIYSYEETNYDSDFEDPPPKRNHLQEKIEEYGVKVLFEDGSWKCNENGKKRILEILNENKIPVESLTNVYKCMNGRWR